MVHMPLAAQLRPNKIDDIVGQSHLLAPGKPLYDAFQTGHVHSMVLWGPPGSGKTTIAKLLSHQAKAHMTELSAVLTGVKDIRLAIDKAKERRLNSNQSTVLFIDEVHRFNKSQQDAFLPFVESGDVTFIGATTENPSFELNNALLSRLVVYVLKPLNKRSLLSIIEKALRVKGISMTCPDLLVDAADGDGRRCLNYLELATSLCEAQSKQVIDTDILNQVITNKHRQFDKGGDSFYEQISALHKSIRGSSPDAALYWCLRMLDGGCHPHYVLRRLIRAASEDIGNADPNALNLCLNAWDTFDKLGSPEGELAIAQAVLYLASAPKSNATYTAYKSCLDDVKNGQSFPVPMHLRNAPTGLLKKLGYGQEYQYPHDHREGYIPSINYFPFTQKRKYYFPAERGLEKKIKEKLDYLNLLDEKHKNAK